MARCPYCGSKARLSSILNYNRWSPYICPRCGRVSRFRTWHLVALGTGAVFAYSALKRLGVPYPLVFVFILMIITQGYLLKLYKQKV